MASLDKMAIRGIRSFDDKSINIIQFYTPLTVIVGYNGSGKTTIIECLKYATTGDLPPNTKGGAFVHDPKMATTTEVKAQVRLRFHSVNKVRINVTRNLQVSVKRGGGLTMKTLEGLLQVDDENVARNKRAVLSTRCAELDEEMPRLLGVSRAVLENVIFCHQEDSNWPLSEPASLKKKFDDIFEATRYTKALDNIKALRKERAVQLRVDLANLQGLEREKEHCEAVRAKKRELEARLSDRETQLEDLRDEVRGVTAANRELYDKAVRFREMVNQAETLESKIQIHEGNIRALREHMDPIDASEEELMQRDESFGDHVRSQERKRDELLRKVSSKKDEMGRVESLANRASTEKGALEKERETHEEAKQLRAGEVARISRELGIKGFDQGDLSEDQARDFTARVQSEARRLEAELTKLKGDANAREEEQSASYQDAQSNLRSLQMSRDTTLNANRRLKERLKALENQLDEAQVGESDVDAMEREQKAAADKLETARAELAAATFDERLREKTAEIRDADDRREELTAELNSLNRHADFRAKLDMKRKDAQAKEEESRSLLHRHAAALKKHIDSDLDPATVETHISRAGQKLEQDLASLEKVEQEKNKALQHIESSLSIARQQMREKKEEARKLDEELQAGLREDETSVEQGLQTAEEEIAVVSENLNSIANTRAFFERNKKHGEGKHECMGCGRGLELSDMEKFLKYVSTQLAKFGPEAEAEYRGDLEYYQERKAALQALLPRHGRRKTLLETDIPKLEASVREAESRLADSSTQAQESADAVEDARSVLREVNNLRKVAGDVTRLLAERKGLEREVQALESDLASTGNARTGDEVQQAIDELSASIKRLKREQETLTRERDAKRAQLSTLERELHRSEMATAARRQELAQRQNLVKRKEDCEAELGEGTASLQRLEGQIADGAAPLRQAKDALEALRQENEKVLAEMQGKAGRSRSFADKLADLDAAVERYATKRVEQRLKDCLERISDLQLQRAAVEQEITDLDSESARITRDINQGAATQRNIKDNIRYLQLRRELAKHRQELQGLDLEGASEANRVWTTKYNEAKERENDLNGQAAHLGGEISTLRAQIKERDAELRENFKDVDDQYRKRLIETKTSEMANNDLEKYAKALDNAIMQYHSIKMEEINEQIRYLWGKTYQGTDIDTIVIRSDNENAKGNRSYNYRVVMLKDNVELDMRGRCSAGQKVLASIIIRLALADSFGNSCGILALDEPTTNLDQENIEALAKSLSDLIKERQSSQFQLIVITHDEEFLTRLGQNDVLEFYWRVSRDSQQKSIIQRERIS